MPAQRPRASFEPIPPDLDLQALVESTANFQFVPRIKCEMIDQEGFEAFDRLVHLHVVIGGKPLVIEGYNTRLDEWTFSPKWLQDNLGEKIESARDLTKKESMALTIGHYLRNMSKLTEQWFDRPGNYKEKDRQRMYLKDIDCPEVWQDKLRETLPRNLFYFNDNMGERGGPGSVDELISGGGKRPGHGIAPSGDLMSSLPPSMRAENIMCYIGHEGTYTPAHREMCASLGQNIMVETSGVLGDDGRPERPGSSIWFMTETNERHLVSEYWLSQLGHDIEVENHFGQIAAWKKAPFTTWVVEQKAGDFILIPPMAPHQVWNRGTRTMKAAWNRTTVETLELAMKEALPNARLVCRDEQYKNKAIIYYTLEKYSGLLARVRDQEQTATSPQEAAVLRTSPKIKQLNKDFKRLFNLFKGIMLSESFGPEHHDKNPQFFPFESNITCAYCRGNIFNRFLTCTNCDYALNTPESEPYDICMDCYAMGRSCGCISKLRWCEQFKWKELVQKYEHWRRQYIEIERGLKPSSPLPIAEERAKLTEKTLAQVCQDQLKRRPFVDINKPQPLPQDDASDENEEIEVNDEGIVKKKRKRKSEAWLRSTHSCHVCCHRHDKWKMAECKCTRWWCYGALFRAHDLMPFDVMKDPMWMCPHCQNICGAGNCRKDPRQNPYKPQRTLLGHDTRKVADARSVESLVDFSVSNIQWLNETSKEAPRTNERLAMRQEEAERAKAVDTSELDPYATDEENQADGIHYEDMNSAIDPALSGEYHDSRVPRITNMANGSHNGAQNLDDRSIYQAAAQSGYVNPSAVLHRPPEDDDGEGDTEFPDAEDADRDDSGRKKKRSKSDEHGKPAKKKQRTDDLAVSDATKQYRKEQERKALEEARKQGRFIQVHAALKGKSKLVKLRLPRVRLSNLGGGNTQAHGEENVLLRSDIAPPKVKALPTVDPTPEKAAKQVRIRVEHDEDFGGGRRGRDRKSTDGKVKKKGTNVDYEEVDIPSEEEADAEENGIQVDGAVKRTATGGTRRRISAWQKKHADPATDGLKELPETTQPTASSGTAPGGPKSAQKRPRKPAGKSIPQIRPLGDPFTQSDKDEAYEAEEAEEVVEEAEREEAVMVEVRENNALQTQRETASAALQQAEENAQAKMAAARILDAESEGESELLFVETSTLESPAGTKKVATRGPAVTGSIMERRGPGGRSIKIVSAARRQTTGGMQSGKGFTAVNPAAKSSPVTRD